MRAAFIVIAAALAGCTSATPSPSTVPERERVIIGGLDVNSRDGATLTSMSTGTLDVKVAGTPAQLRPIVKRAYETVGIPVTLDDPGTWRIGNMDFWRSRRLQNQRLSRFVSCGDGLTGPNADNFRVFFSVVTTIAPTAGGSMLRTSVVASAQDVAGGNPDRILCGTTGALEALIAKNVQAAGTPQ